MARRTVGLYCHLIAIGSRMPLLLQAEQRANNDSSTVSLQATTASAGSDAGYGRKLVTA
jgi:hypothetical protein